MPAVGLKERRGQPPRRRQGDWRLAQYEQGIEPWRTEVESDLREGATKDDIRAWWNLKPKMQAQLQLQDETAKFVMFTQLREEGGAPDEAAQRIRRRFPYFSEPDDGPAPSGEDRPLPITLKPRIIFYFNNLPRLGLLDSVLSELDSASSFNAWLRSQIRAGLF